MTGNPLTDFSQLTPDLVLELIEDALGRRASNLCRPLMSYINRVYEVKMDDDTWVVAKFYRPGRWSPEALQDEQDFVTELAAAEVPVVAPIPGRDGKTLQSHRVMHFAIFPKKGGRPCEEPTDPQWLELGRLLARVHNVGAAHPPRDRIRIHPRISTAKHLEEILRSGISSAGLQRQYEDVVADLIEHVAPMFDAVETLRLHGDCHAMNIIQRPGESFFLIDFDDMATGPAVQDLWMLLPGHARNAQRELNLLLEGYETFRELDHHELALIEPLRAMRMIHYTAWCAHQKADGGFARLSPDWGSTAFWGQEIRELEKQKQEILDSSSGHGIP